MINKPGSRYYQPSILKPGTCVKMTRLHDPIPMGDSWRMSFPACRGDDGNDPGGHRLMNSIFLRIEVEKVTLKLVAQYADACNVYGDLETIKHKFAVIKEHCAAIGRDYESIHRTATLFCSIAETDAQARKNPRRTSEPFRRSRCADWHTRYDPPTPGRTGGSRCPGTDPLVPRCPTT